MRAACSKLFSNLKFLPDHLIDRLLVVAGGSGGGVAISFSPSL